MVLHQEIGQQHDMCMLRRYLMFVALCTRIHHVGCIGHAKAIGVSVHADIFLLPVVHGRPFGS